MPLNQRNQTQTKLTSVYANPEPQLLKEGVNREHCRLVLGSTGHLRLISASSERYRSVSFYCHLNDCLCLRTSVNFGYVRLLVRGANWVCNVTPGPLDKMLNFVNLYFYEWLLLLITNLFASWHSSLTMWC